MPNYIMPCSGKAFMGTIKKCIVNFYNRTLGVFSTVPYDYLLRRTTTCSLCATFCQLPLVNA